MIVLVTMISTGQVLAAQLRCVDAARAAARLAARGEPGSRSVEVATRLGPGGSRVDVEPAGTIVTVSVSVDLRLPIGITVPLHAEAAADQERP